MKKLKLINFAVAIGWTIILWFCVIHNTTNNRFPVTQFAATENQPSFTRVDSSPAISWEKTSSLAMTTGFVFFALMWGLTIAVSLDWLTFLDTEKSSTSSKLPWFSVVLSIIFFFSGYSSRLVSNYVTIPTERFEKMVEVGAVEKKDATWIELEGDSLTHLFDDKEWIK